MPTRICLHCSSFSIRRSRRRGFFEVFVLPLLFQRPYRCLFCYARFYASVLRKRKLQTPRVQAKTAVVSLLAPADAGVFKMTVVALLIPALIAMAGPARTYVHDAVPERWKYMLNNSDQPAQTTKHEARALPGDAPLISSDCCGVAGSAQFALASHSRGVNLFAGQQEGAHVAIGRMQSSGAVFVNDAPVSNDTTIFERDLVRTGSNGAARVDVKDRGTISIFANSKVSFTGSWRYFASLLAGKISYFAFPAASKFQLNIGQFVLTPSADSPSAAEIDIAADGSALVRATQGSIGIIALEGPASLFLKAGQAARITSAGETFPADVQEAQAEQAAAPGKVPETKPQPQRTPQPAVKKNNGRIVLIVVAVAGGAGAALALGKGGSGSSSGPPISPSTP